MAQLLLIMCFVSDYFEFGVKWIGACGIVLPQDDKFKSAYTGFRGLAVGIEERVFKDEINLAKEFIVNQTGIKKKKLFSAD